VSPTTRVSASSTGSPCMTGGTADAGQQPAHRQVLVILDMNGVLIHRDQNKKKRGVLRPNMEAFLDELEKLQFRITIAVWSAMSSSNLQRLVLEVFGAERAAKLAFVWDQQRCTVRQERHTHKPLFRKDLSRLKQTVYSDFVPERVLLIDDDPAKCTANPAGTVIHPLTFRGFPEEMERDDELLRLSTYLKGLAESDCPSAREYVLDHPYVKGEKAKRNRRGKMKRPSACSKKKKKRKVKS